MMNFIVIHTSSNTQWGFKTMGEAVNFIGEMEEIDPEGVFNGVYHIDDMTFYEEAA